MKPFPTNTGISLAPDLVPERPWWTLEREVWRNGGDTSPEEPRTYRRWDGQSLEAPVAEALEALAELDRKHPIPEPRFRPGQVWLFDAQQTCLTATLDMVLWPPTGGNSYRGPGAPLYEVLGILGGQEDQFEAFGASLHKQPLPRINSASTRGFSSQEWGFFILGRYLPQMEGQDLLRSLHSQWDAYLIFDPCNQQGGIWTAAREES